MEMSLLSLIDNIIPANNSYDPQLMEKEIISTHENNVFSLIHHLLQQRSSNSVQEGSNPFLMLLHLSQLSCPSTPFRRNALLCCRVGVLLHPSLLCYFVLILIKKNTNLCLYFVTCNAESPEHRLSWDAELFL